MYLFYHRKISELRVIVIIVYIVYSFCTDVLTKYLDENGLVTATFENTSFSLFTIVEFCSFSLFFYFTLLAFPLLRNVIIVIIVMFVIFCVINLYFQFNRNNNLDTIPVTFQAIFIMSMCLVYFFEQIRTPNSLFIYSTSEFWIVTSILVYLAGTFFIFIYSSNLTKEEFHKYWPINYVFNTIKNILFGLAIFIQGRKHKQRIDKDSLDYYSIIENP